MLFCKGADSAMMLDGVCEGVGLLEDLATSDVESDSEVQNAEFASLLGIQAHLGGKFVARSVNVFYLILCAHSNSQQL